MISGDHTRACLHAEARRRAAQARYDRRWPNQCPHCQTHTNSEHPCQHCLSNYFTCPRCSRPHAMDEEDATIPCKYCGFDENNEQHQRPLDYECRCRVAEAEATEARLRNLRLARDHIQQEIDRIEEGIDVVQLEEESHG